MMREMKNGFVMSWEGNFLEEKSLGGLVVPCFVSDDYAILRGKAGDRVAILCDG